jgi:hypothetical protein
LFWRYVIEEPGEFVTHPDGGRIVSRTVRKGARGKAEKLRQKERARLMEQLVKAGLAERVFDGWRILPRRKPEAKS